MVVLSGQTGKNWTGILNLLADSRADMDEICRYNSSPSS